MHTLEIEVSSLLKTSAYAFHICLFLYLKCQFNISYIKKKQKTKPHAKYSSSFHPNATKLVSPRHQSPSHQSCSNWPFRFFFTEHALAHFKHSHKINLCKISSSSSEFPITSQLSAQREGQIQASLALLFRARWSGGCWVSTPMIWKSQWAYKNGVHSQKHR